MPEKVSETYRTKLGTFHGLEAGIILHPLGGTEVYLDGAVRCREQLMRDVWGMSRGASSKTLDMHVSWLRRKLGDDAASPRLITTIRGLGFRFERG